MHSKRCAITFSSFPIDAVIVWKMTLC